MSRYSTAKLQKEGFELIELYDSACSGKAAIIPQIGNNVIAFECWGHQVILPPTNMNAFMSDTDNHTKYGTPILFPPNRVKNGTIHFNDRIYTLPINEPPDHHLHGDIPRKAWDVVEYGSSEERGAYLSCRFDFAAHPEMMAYFPHELSFIVTHTLHEGRLTMEIKVTNHGTVIAPFALGLHPYFVIPDADNHENILTVPTELEWPVNNKAFATGLPSNTTFCENLKKGISLTDYPELGCSLIEVAEGDRTCHIELKKSGYRIAYQVDKCFPFLLLFKPNWASAISLEPYTYVTDAFNLPYDYELTGAKGIEAGEELSFNTAMWVELI